MAPRADRLPIGITRVHPHTRRALRTPPRNWPPARTGSGASGCGGVAQATSIGSIRRTYARRCGRRSIISSMSGPRPSTTCDGTRSAQRRASSPTTSTRTWRGARAPPTTAGECTTWHSGRHWLATKLGAIVQTRKITPALVELALEEWKQATMTRKKSGRVQRRWSSATLRTRALHLSNLFAVLYPASPNPVLALKDRLPPKSPEVEKAQPMPVVMALLEAMRNPPLVARRKHPSFASVRAARLGIHRESRFRNSGRYEMPVRLICGRACFGFRRSVSSNATRRSTGMALCVSPWSSARPAS